MDMNSESEVTRTFGNHKSFEADPWMFLQVGRDDSGGDKRGGRTRETVVDIVDETRREVHYQASRHIITKNKICGRDGKGSRKQAENFEYMLFLTPNGCPNNRNMIRGFDCEKE
ncbi:hypothetical protein ALC53_06287 [Atta colombica]|uniref:Uncharacterized protein n=1 Tax=Atta colombica TaxID=520822 RepID=A0A195BFR3_9HYME|nr:hypothetical protein ALC53_06287 [Atta colombica]